jgi:cysteine desulfurase
MRIYLDNAATTPLSKEVFSAMEPYLFEHFGNASSAHGFGREARTAVSKARANIADLLNANPDNIIFTSGGTESDNAAIISSIRSNKIKVAITSALEHHAVLNTLRALERDGEIRLFYLNNEESGNLSLRHLQQLLQNNERAFVSVMHGNNEIGNLNNIEEISGLCCSYGAIFHSDTVQTMGHHQYDTKSLKADFLVGSAHKFHGPKGVGFLYKREKSLLLPHIQGGSQEGGQRGGTENVAGIVGLAKALEITSRDRQILSSHISSLKQRMITGLSASIEGLSFNGNSGDLKRSLSSVLSVSLPTNRLGIPVLGYLDSIGICASGGSACTSKSAGSHVLNAIGVDGSRDVLRLSFSRNNTFEEVDHTIAELSKLFSFNGVLEIANFAKPILAVQ